MRSVRSELVRTARIGPELRAALDAVYAAFAPFAKLEAIVTCDCNSCVAPEVNLRMVATRAADVSESLMKEWIHSAHAWSPVADVKHFLPRILELVALGQGPNHYDTALVLDRMAAHDWRTWPAAEREPIARALDALFAAALDDDEPLFEEPILSVVFLLLRAQHDMANPLRLWTNLHTRAADARLYELAAATTETGFSDAPSFEHWRDGDPSYLPEVAKLHAWVRSETTDARVAAFRKSRP